MVATILIIAFKNNPTNPARPAWPVAPADLSSGGWYWGEIHAVTA